MAKQIKSADAASWWRFAGPDDQWPTGDFCAQNLDRVDRLYFPLPSEAGVLSWSSRRLHGGLIADQNKFFSLPLSAGDMSDNLVHRDFWVVEEGKPPFSLSGLSPDGLKAHVVHGTSPATCEAGPGWFRLKRKDAKSRFEVTATLWCPSDRNEKLEVFQVEVHNTSRRTLSFSPYAGLPIYARSADDVRDHRHVTALLNRVSLSKHGVTVCPTMSFDERGHKVNHVQYHARAYGPRGQAPASIWPTQESFCGPGGNMAAPAAVWQRQAAPTIRRDEVDGREAMGGFRFGDASLKPGQRVAFVFVTAIDDAGKGATRWNAWAKSASSIKASLAKTQLHWKEYVQQIAFKSGDAVLDNWMSWVTLQPTLRRLYGNSFLPEFDYGRGGRGWRDLWQDCLALLLSDPTSVRAMLLHNFGGVRIDGSNATIIGKDGEFLADRNNIPRTWMDHGVWPVYTTLLYVDQTGDYRILLQDREYFRDPQTHRCQEQDDAWTEAYGNKLKARNGKIYKGTILEHMLIQNLTAFFNVGAHNMCLLEGADWNDGLDMASQRGESVAFASFYAWNLKRLADTLRFLESKGIHDIELAEETTLLLDRLPGGQRVNYTSHKKKQGRLQAFFDEVARDVSGRKKKCKTGDLRRDLEAKADDLSCRIAKQEWVRVSKSASFFNGYYNDDGKRVEGAHKKGVRMMLTSQVFPLMGNIASEAQVDDVVRAARKILRDPRHGGIRLNSNFKSIEPKLGRAFSFAYGEKENGAVFSHMAVMYAYALYVRRRAKEGREVWHALYRMANAQDVAKIFPCLPEYFNAQGRGMYCYLTGSASWLAYLMLTRVYGLRGRAGDLVIDPQLTRADFGERKELAVKAPFAGRSLTISLRNADNLESGRYKVASVRCGGKLLAFRPNPEGGVAIRRSTITRLARNAEHRLAVTLERA